MKKAVAFSAQQDRDRILHSRAFRQLDRKSELFLDPAGELLPSRLFYALQAASIARILAERLLLNESVAEVLVLSDALGHPAFGRAGTEALDRLMADHGGFDPDAQSLRVALELEMKHPEFNGLELSDPVREILQGRKGLPEAGAASWGRRLARLLLDLESGLDAGLVTEAWLDGQALWQEIAAPAAQRYPKLVGSRRQAFHLQNLLTRLVDALAAPGEGRPPAFREEKTAKAFAELEAGIEKAVRRAPSLDRLYQDRGACLETLFAIYVHRPHLLAERHGLRLKKDGVHRAVADFLADAGDRELLRLSREIAGEEENAHVHQTPQGLLL
ncbi:MAG: hypothetical protein PW734_09555 [Verrucomicrobium sp.]|nr:hypothetical protein [Verrucomicrobium sp.]